MQNEHYKFQRLFIDKPLEGEIEITAAQAHYLGNVLRKKPGDKIRIFNGQNGEFFAEISVISKKTATLTLNEQIRPQPQPKTHNHLLFAPLKKNRMDFVIEKCTELGITDFHPILTNRTEVRTIKVDRLKAQIIEACEQSERLTIPKLHNLETLDKKVTHWHETPAILGCIERTNTPPIGTLKPTESNAFIIGPVGGFNENEREFMLSHPKIKPISLGENILRAETAAMLCASWVYLQ